MLDEDSLQTHKGLLDGFLEATQLTKGAAQNIKLYFDSDLTKSDLEVALNTILPNTFSIAWPIIELVREGHLVPSFILMRSLVDRLGTIAWIRKHGASEFAKWEPNYPHSKRPKLDKKLECLDCYVEEPTGAVFDLGFFINENWTSLLNGASHGDVEDALFFATKIEGESVMHLGPNVDNKTLIAAIANLGIMVLAQLNHEIRIAIPNAYRRLK